MSLKEKKIPSEGRLTLPWGELAYQKWPGSPSHLPVVACHGWLDNSNSFHSLIPLLDYPGEIYALDLSGHGLSDHRPHGTPYYFLDGVIDIGDAIEALGFQKSILMGHSLGGGILSFVCGMQPEKFAAMVLIEALGPFSSPESEFPKQFRQFLTAREQGKTKGMPLYPSIERAVDARLTVGGILRTSVEVLCERGLRAVDGGFTWRSDSRLRFPSPFRMTEGHILATLGEIRCPTLLVRGMSGMDFPEPFFSARKRVIASLSGALIDGGHHLHLDEPESTADPIREFLRKFL